MTDEFISPAAALDQEHPLGETEAARIAAELAARDAPPPHVIRRKSVPPAPARFVTRKQYEADMAALSDVIGKALAEYVGAKVNPLLERIAELEARKSLHDAGIWQADKSYDVNAIVSHSGSAWVAKSPSEGIRPGENSNGTWRLLVKRGKDGKDGESSRKLLHALA